MYAKLNPPALGVALGTLWAVVIPLVTWLNALTGGPGAAHPGWFTPLVRAIDFALPGYGVGFFGGIWGGILGFLLGLAVGTFVATVYNRMANPVEEDVAAPAAEEEDLS